MKYELTEYMHGYLKSIEKYQEYFTFYAITFLCWQV